MFLSDCYSNDSIISIIGEFKNVLLITTTIKLLLSNKTLRWHWPQLYYSRQCCILYKGYKIQFQNSDFIFSILYGKG